jgi:hypothetical protein
MRGPIDYIIVGFEGNNFKGEILEELQKAVEAGTISVLDLGLILRDADGTVTSVELTDTGSLKIEGGLITDDDINEVGELLEDNSSAGLLIVEQLWAKGLKQAIINANGVLLDEGRIHPDAGKELDSEEGK